MYNNSNEFLIESAEIDLLVTEGMADKAKNAVDKVITRIRELINKIINFIKGKLTKQAKQTEEVIKVVEKKVEAKEIEPEPPKPIKTLDLKKAQIILGNIDLLLETVFKASSVITSDVNKEIEMVTEDLDNLKKVNEKFTGDIMNLVHGMKKLKYDAEYNLKMITKVEGSITRKLNHLESTPSEKTPEMFKLVGLLQSSVSFATRLNSIILSNIGTTFLQINK